MGNRSYLYFEKTPLFEANNSLPFFWISILDKGILDSYKPAWKRYEELLSGNEDELDIFFESTSRPLDFKIDKSQFQKNVHRAKVFVQQHYPEYCDLYNDFEQFIVSKFGTDDYLILSMLEFSNFYTTIDEFLESIYNEVKAIDENKPEDIKFIYKEDVIGSIIGFPESKDFYNLSDAYTRLEIQANQNRSPIVNNGQSKGFSWKLFLWYAFMLLLCPVFTMIAVLMFLESRQIDFWLIVIVLSNLGFYAYSFYKLKEQVLLYKARKK